jgi:hypothetical protein
MFYHMQCGGLVWSDIHCVVFLTCSHTCSAVFVICPNVCSVVFVIRSYVCSVVFVICSDYAAWYLKYVAI